MFTNSAVHLRAKRLDGFLYAHNILAGTSARVQETHRGVPPSAMLITISIISCRLYGCVWGGGRVIHNCQVLNAVDGVDVNEQREIKYSTI